MATVAEPILPALPELGLGADVVENERYIRCIAHGCEQVFDKQFDDFSDFERHMHIHEMAEALADGEDYLPGGEPE